MKFDHCSWLSLLSELPIWIVTVSYSGGVGAGLGLWLSDDDRCLGAIGMKGRLAISSAVSPSVV